MVNPSRLMLDYRPIGCQICKVQQLLKGNRSDKLDYRIVYYTGRLCRERNNLRILWFPSTPSVIQNKRIKVSAGKKPCVVYWTMETDYNHGNYVPDMTKMKGLALNSYFATFLCAAVFV